MIYWTMNSVPELKGMEKAEQKRLFKEMYKEGRSRLGGKQLAIRALGFIVAVALVFQFWPQILFLGAGSLGTIFLGGLIGMLVALPAIVLIQTPIIDKGREWLREQGHPKK